MPITLHLNDYQAANLRWLLRVAWECMLPEYPALNTGDWVGEIPQMLEQEMIENDVPNTPNAQDKWASKPLEGVCGGKKRKDYEIERCQTALRRIIDLAICSNTTPEEKLRLIEETARHWWGLAHVRALDRG